MSTKDQEMMADITDRLESDKFYNKVAKKVAELRGVPLTEQYRREIVANLRRGSSTVIKDDPAPKN